jgi:hypothetical protein
MDIERVKEAARDYLRSWEVLKQAELEADALRDAAWDFYSALKARMSPEELEKRWEILKAAAERVLGGEAKG